MNSSDPLLAAIGNADHREVGGVQVDTVPAGDSRIKRLVYAPGFRWSTHIKPLVGTELCMHGHVGFLARGQIGVRYADGCIEEFRAPAVLAIEPGHDGWVIGEEQAVLIEFDFERDTVSRIGLNGSHRHTV